MAPYRISIMNDDIGKFKKQDAYSDVHSACRLAEKKMGTMYFCIQTFEQCCTVTTLFTVVNNIVEPESGVTTLKSIVENCE